MCTKGEALPFDIAQMDTIFFDNEFAGRAPAVQQLTDALRAIEEGRSATNPVSLVQDLDVLASSPLGAADVLADQLHDLRRAVAELRSGALASSGQSTPAPGEHAMRLLAPYTLGDKRLADAGLYSVTLGFSNLDEVELSGVHNGVVHQESIREKDWWIQSDHRVRELGARLVRGLLDQAASK
jgi:hypothetical protein